MSTHSVPSLRRRDALRAAFSSVGLAALGAEELSAQEQMNRNAPISPKDNLKVTQDPRNLAAERGASSGTVTVIARMSAIFMGFFRL